jgi:MYXO-CTERM domain-containing protein
MNPRLISGLVLGASLLAGGVATSAPFIATFEGHDDMYGGALWRNDRPNNNNQRGAGLEHQKVIRVGQNILVVGTGSYTNITPMIPGAGLSSAEAGILPPADAGADGIGSQARGTRIQGLCASYKLDPIMGLVKTNMAYFTNNDSPDWQNAHKMNGVPINGGAAALVMYGYDPNGNRTRVYAKVLGPNCELLSPQQQQFADNNDDYGGLNVAQELAADGAASRACGTFIGNGNGEDDGHAFCVTATMTAGTGANTYSVAPNFEINTEPNEERTRAEVSMTSIPGHMLACWAAGNNQPPDKGLRCGLINTAPGVAENQRLVWRQYVAQRDGNIMYSTPTVTAIQTADGKPSDKFMLSYVKVDTSNRNGRYKGRTEILSLPLQVTTTGFTKLDEPRKGLFGLSDGAHPGATAGYYGVDKRPVSFLWSGNVTDGGPGTVKIIGITADNKLEPVRALNWASGTSGGYMSLWYGNNPNTPQGRSYPVSTTLVDNVGYGVAGGFQPDVKAFLVAANVHPMDHAGCVGNDEKGSNNGRCGGKNAFSVSLIPVAADPASTGSNPNPDDPNPTDPTDPAGEVDDNPGQTLSGCSTTGAGDFGALLFLGLGLAFIRRRRS